ncbi:MAG: phage holin family protein [Rhodothermales bacterium]
MEEIPERSSAESEVMKPPSRQLPAGVSKLDRISQHTKGLFEEISGWVDLKIKLVQVDLQEKLEAKKIQIALGAAMGLTAFFAVLFLLTSIALGVGAWLGHPAWGFLIVTVLLFVVVGVLRMAMKKMVAGIEEKVNVEERWLSNSSRNGAAT